MAALVLALALVLASVRATIAMKMHAFCMSCAAIAAVSLLIGCVPVIPPDPFYTSTGGDPHRERGFLANIAQDEWTLSRERFALMRSQLPQKPYVERVRINAVYMTGQMFSARGAVAVSPDHAARLVLLGPGGTTALDVWVTRDRYRVAIPSINLETRGGTDASAARGLPIGFLRWWFLGPLSGELVLARSSDAETELLLRDGPGTVMMKTNGADFIAIRREKKHLEGLQWFGGNGLLPTAGARGRYEENQWGMRIYVVIEEVLPDEPDPAAFADPDDKGTAL